MTTKIARESSISDQVAGLLLKAARGIAQDFNLGASHIPTPHASMTTAKPTAIYCGHFKASEATRQMERVRQINERVMSDQDTSALQVKSIASTISLISNMIVGPIPIPVASSGEDGEATLYFDDDVLYGDIEIRGDRIEYLLKTKGGDEIFDEEEIESGLIPPRLLFNLYCNYIRK